MFEIRAHHLLCMQSFHGLGYSADFVDNMSKVINAIKKNPQTKLIITSECDSICRCCPHNHENICAKEPDSYNKIKNMDKLVLKKINLKEKEKIAAKDIFAIINSKIKNTQDAEIICGSCSWRMVGTEQCSVPTGGWTTF